MRRVSGRWVDVVGLLALGLASSAWCLTASPRLGAVFDEPFYVKAGLTKWRTGSNKMLMRSGVMTLPTDVQTLPVYLWERSRGVSFDPVADLHAVLPLARGMNLVFWWLLLVYALRLGRTFGGAWGGRLAVALTACDPNLLGHATLATTDIACVATLLVLVYHFWHGRGCGWGRRVLVPGLCYGLAIQAKASGLVFGLQAMAVLGLWHLGTSGALSSPAGTSARARLAHLWHATYGLRRDLAVIGLIGLTAVFVYTGSDWTTEASFVRWAERLPEGGLKSVLVPVSENLRIFTNAGEGLLYQIQHNVRGHGTFLLGQWYPKATWEYFPVALSMKLPIPVLALLAAVLLTGPRHLLTPPAAVALLLLLLSPTYRVQIGVRFVFGLMVLGYVALGAAVARGWASPGGRGVPRRFVAGVVVTLGAISVGVWPHGLSFFNRLWGGPERGPRLLHDSNCDWGQGLPELRDWLLAHGLPTIAVWYYGNDPAVNQPPFFRAFLSHLPHDGSPEGIARLCGGNRLLAVSVGCLYGHDTVTESHRRALEWVRSQRPLARTTFFQVYRLP